MSHNPDLIRDLVRRHGAFSLYEDERGNAPYLVTWDYAIRLYPSPQLEADRTEIMRTGIKTLGVTVSGNQIEIRPEEGPIQRIPVKEPKPLH